MSEPSTPTATPPATATTTLERTAAKVPVQMGLAPQTWDEGWRMANALAKGEDMVPKQYRNRPEAVLIAIQMGIELGLAPMQALQSLAVIGGRPGLWGDGMLALIISSPHYQDHDEYYEVEVEHTMHRRDGLTLADMKVDSTVAVCTFIRRGKPTPVTRRFSVGQARKAGYLPEANMKGGGKEGPWQTHPDRMLAMRARGFAARDAFPDVLRGIRLAEELRDIPSDPDEPTPLRVVHRMSEHVAPMPVPPPGPEDAPAPKPVPPPPPNVELVGPVGVLRVEHLIGGPCAFLADGTQLWLANIEDAKEVEKFGGTAHRLVFDVIPVEGAPQQRTALSFAIAE